MKHSTISMLMTMLAAATTNGCGGKSGAATRPAAPATTSVAELRAGGPAALDQLLASYDALPEGAEKRAMARLIDQVAAQRYAHVSRLYWYTDLEAAKAAARESGKPILSLRLLGDLRDDYTCVNSRFFRVVLYANDGVSAFLRDNFVLHWSSERPAARVTVDFGDGRKLERTVAGNSIHYLLDAEGRPVEALPGLWSPVAFRRELEAALPLARQAGKLEQAAWQQQVAAFHRQKLAALESSWQRDGRVNPGSVVFDDGTVLEAEYLTVSKAAIERPLVRQLKLGPQVARITDEAPMWLQAGLRHLDGARLDARSRALFASLGPTDWAAEPRALHGEALASSIERFELQVAADTMLNTYKTGWQVHAWLAESPETSLEALNRRVYGELFLTPAKDPWLGMAAKDGFLALPGDGLTVPAKAAVTASR